MHFSKFENMDSMTDSFHAEELDYSTSLMFKEYFFLVIVVLMAVAGLSLCVNKLYPEAENDIEEILVHDAEFAHIAAGKSSQ